MTDFDRLASVEVALWRFHDPPLHPSTFEAYANERDVPISVFR